MDHETKIHKTTGLSLALMVRDEFFHPETAASFLTLSDLVATMGDWRYWGLRGGDEGNAAIVQRTYQGGMSTASGETPERALARAILIELHRETNGS